MCKQKVRKKGVVRATSACELFEMINGETSCILIISPLQALMLDQVEKLTRLGIKATIVGECQKDKGNEITILNG